MPEISRFFGISIKMYFGDHEPPHFHTEYGEHKAVVDIHTLVVIGGYLPPRVLGLVVEWASQHQVELLALWKRAINQQPLHKIPPLS
ncbi:MAG: hypothetical protein DDT19_02790 [Syntrophomonadaceae bacterium]|nr:DUF4160 domain-containing protein [Candidatus Hakubella thermalkaliphila]MBT9169430.1 hypothetical protein [Bacillota bacterium]